MEGPARSTGPCTRPPYPGVVGVGASCHAASYRTWPAPPNEVVGDVPGCAVTLGTSGACVVAAWRHVNGPPDARA